MDGNNLDRDIWTNVMHAVKRAAKAVGRTGRRCVYADALIAAMYLWCVWHDRPLYWACDRGHYNTLFRPRKLPSVSQFTRRVKTAALRRPPADPAAGARRSGRRGAGHAAELPGRQAAGGGRGEQG